MGLLPVRHGLRHFSPQNTLQTSQTQVSPVVPNGSHLLLKYQAVWLCRLGEIIHQSLISGRSPIMAAVVAPHGIAFLVTLSVCFGLVYGWSCRTFARIIVVLKFEPVPS